MFTIRSDFIGSFKLGGNINHNLKILAYLYERQNDPTDHLSWVLRKPIIITIASICEAVLYDFHFRICNFTREGVTGLDESSLDYVRSKHIDKFELYIASAKKQEFLGTRDDPIYDELEELRKLRNRVHIQNDKSDFEPNESEAFNRKRQEVSERTLEKMLKLISANHNRPPSVRGNVEPFKLPWPEHFKEPRT